MSSLHPSNSPYQLREMELPLLNHGTHRDREERMRLASSSHSSDQAISNLANSTVDQAGSTSSSLHRDQEGEDVLDGYITETSDSTQSMAVANTDPNYASDDNRSKLLRPTVAPVQTRADENQKWHPFWLRPAVLGAFAAFFLCCAVALPVLLALSQKNNGLLEARRDLEQLWRFGPTAVFTIVTIFWSRVELQTQRYFPWLQSQNSNEYYALDYTSKISVNILFQALRNKHFMIFITTLATLLLKVQIVLMPSLFFLQTMQVAKPVVVQTWDYFDPDFVHEIDINTNPVGYYNARAIRDFDTGIPFGVGNHSIYQTFTQANTEKDARGTIDSPLTAIVDGLFFDTECRELENCTSIYPENSTFLDLDLKFEGCSQSFRTPTTIPYHTRPWTRQDHWVLMKSPANCSVLPDQFDQFVYLATEWAPSPKNYSIPIGDACAGVICSSTAWLSKVEVLDDGVYPSITVLPNQTKIPTKTDPFRIVANSVPTTLGGEWLRHDNYSYPVTDTGPFGPLKINSLLLESIDISKKYSGGVPHSLFGNQMLHESMLNLTRSLGPLVAHHELRTKKESRTTGSRLFKTTRLQLNHPVCICMALLSGLLAFVSLWAMLKYKGTFRNWDKNPATILGLMTFFRDQKLDPLSEQRKTRSKLWSQSQDSPLPLPTWLRVIFTVYVTSLIISLITILQISNNSDGVVTLKEGTLSLWWTLIPTLAMFLVTLYTTSSDTTIRDLAIFSTLNTRPCTMKELDASLLDMLGFRALYYSLRWKIYTVTLSQLLAIACGFLASFSSLLFTSATRPSHFNISLKQQSWFGSRPLAQENIETGKLSESEIASYAVDGLIITQKTSNFTWPEFTYRDLIFPRLEIDGPSQDWNSSVSFELEAPAAKFMPKCTQLSRDIIKITPDTRVPSEYTVTANLSYPCPNGTTINTQVQGTTMNGSYMITTLRPRIEPCPTDLWMAKTFIWGKLSDQGLYDTNKTYEHVAIWNCNYTWSEIPTKLNMLWTGNGLGVDHQKPPSPDYSRVKPLYPPLRDPLFNDSMIWPQLDNGNTFTDGWNDGKPKYLINYAFQYLFEPAGSLKAINLGDPNYDQRTLAALHGSYALAAAQLANSLNRLSVEETSTTSPEHPGELPAINAIVTDQRRVRLIQNQQVTYFIISILSLGFIVNAWALISAGLKRVISYRGKWLLDLEVRGLAPPDFNSIAMSDALLSSSNYSKYIGSLAMLSKESAGLRFRMGWFMRKGGHERELTIGVLDDPEFLFMGGKISDK